MSMIPVVIGFLTLGGFVCGLVLGIYIENKRGEYIDKEHSKQRTKSD